MLILLYNEKNYMHLPYYICIYDTHVVNLRCIYFQHIHIKVKT